MTVQDDIDASIAHALQATAKQRAARPPAATCELCSLDGCALAVMNPGGPYPQVCAHDGNCPKRADAQKNPPSGCCRR